MYYRPEHVLHSALLALVVLVAAGCGPSIGDPVRLKAGAAPQDALFYAGSGWTGGCGEAVLGPDNQIVRLDRTPVFLDEASHQRIMQAAGNPQCFNSGDRILVSARVTLTADHCTRPLPSPEGGIEEDRVDFLRLDLVELHNVVTRLTPCD